MTYYSYLYSFDKDVKLSDEDAKGLLSYIHAKEGSAKNKISIKLIEGENKNFLMFMTCVSKSPVIDFNGLKAKLGDSMKQYSNLPKSRKFQTNGQELLSVLKPLDV